MHQELFAECPDWKDGGGGGDREGRLHFVALPYPLQGHMAPMLQLCNLLAGRGISVSFIHQDSNLASLHFSQPQHAPASIRHISFPNSIPGKPSSSSSSTRSRVLASEKLLPSFSLLLAKLHASTKVSCVIADVLMSWALPAAAELGIHGASLWTAGLSSFATYCNIPLLASERVFPIQAMDEDDAQQLIKCIPCLPPIFRFTDLPSFFHAPTWPDDVLDFITRQVKHMSKSATWVLSNYASTEPETELEQEMSSRIPILSIGPLLTLQHHHFLAAQIPSPGLNAHTRASLWHEDPTCLEWLHGRPSSSVIYISFGSVVVLSPLQIQEIHMGLEAAQLPFLWALRPEAIEADPDDNDGEPLSAPKVLGRSKLGLVIPWAPQLDVLAHDSVGGFITHCGWNSVMESITMGKPMLGFPRFAEQKMNCRLLEHWRVGKELQAGGIDGLVNRHEVEAGVKWLMSEEEGLKSACRTLRAHVLKAISNDKGSSMRNLGRFVADVLKRSG